MLNGNQVKRICATLVDAFTLDDLRQLVRYDLNQRLDSIVATNNSLSQVVFDLVDWGEKNEELIPLLTAAAASRPNNQALAQLAAEISAGLSVSAASDQLHRVDLSQMLRSTGGTQPDVDTTLITWLINRAQQTYELAKVIQHAQNANAPRPFVCLLHGDDDACHEKFVQRIVQNQLQSMIPSAHAGVPQHFLLELPPRGYKTTAELHDFLRATLGDKALKNMAATAGDINERLTDLRAPVVIQTFLSVEGWSKAERQKVLDYLSFWADWPNMSLQQWLLVFLCIRVQPNPPGFFSFLGRKNQKVDLGAALAEFATLNPPEARNPGSARVICALLSELEPITRKDAEGWASDPTVQQIFAGRDLVSEIGRMYANRRETAIPMATLHQMLVETLKLPA